MEKILWENGHYGSTSLKRQGFNGSELLNTGHLLQGVYVDVNNTLLGWNQVQTVVVVTARTLFLSAHVQRYSL